MINHIAIIMDGNRRWAKEKSLPAFMGHKAGADNVEKIINLAEAKGIKYITMWALSTENLKNRPKDEIEFLIKLINNIESYLSKMIKKGLRFETVGNLELLPKESQFILQNIKDKTKDNTGITFILALNYGGKDEIIRGIKKFIKEGGDIDELDEDSFRNYLDVSAFPIPDLIIRTGGDIRHSGFLLYDSAYSEYYFTQKKWPDFDEKELDKAIESFSSSKRNFGK
ncbi:MAG: polyprenyl diphosphate synthase [Candidatus Gracilibacteria bacterium]|nr:polyprenyl diphosphate synthase [Candidatus Gracilibacteria bacterium]